MSGSIFNWNPEEIYHFEFWAFLLYHVTLATLVGLAFRKTDDLVTAWRFAGVILVSWLMTVGALLLIRHEIVARSVTPDVGMVVLQCYVWTQLAARPVSAILYGIAHWLRNGRTGLISFAAAIGISCFVILGWIIAREMFWPSVEFDSNNITREAFWMGFTSLDVTINWVVWYVFLFKKPAGRKEAAV